MSASREVQPAPGDELQSRQRRAKRTAILMAAIALLVYGGFLVSGILSR